MYLEFVRGEVRGGNSRSSIASASLKSQSMLSTYIDSFNVKLKDELLNRESFITLVEAKTLTEDLRREYNQI